MVVETGLQAREKAVLGKSFLQQAFSLCLSALAQRFRSKVRLQLGWNYHIVVTFVKKKLLQLLAFSNTCKPSKDYKKD